MANHTPGVKSIPTSGQRSMAQRDNRKLQNDIDNWERRYSHTDEGITHFKNNSVRLP